MLFNLAVFAALPLDQVATSDAVGRDVAVALFDRWGGSPPRFQTPINSLVFEGLIAIVFVLFGSFNSLSELRRGLRRGRDRSLECPIVERSSERSVAPGRAPAARLPAGNASPVGSPQILIDHRRARP